MMHIFFTVPCEYVFACGDYKPKRKLQFYNDLFQKLEKSKKMGKYKEI